MLASRVLLGEVHAVGQRGEDAVRLVEPDVAVVTDAQQLHVHAAAIGDLALIVGEHGLRVGGEAIRT